MKKLVLAMALSCIPLLAHAGGIYGTWRTEPSDKGDYLLVEIADCGANVCGKIVSSIAKDGKVWDNYENLGKMMLKGMQPSGKNAWSGGTIWAPDVDKTYKSKMKLKGANTLQVTGCVAICTFLTSRSQNWSRVK